MSCGEVFIQTAAQYLLSAAELVCTGLLLADESTKRQGKAMAVFLVAVFSAAQVAARFAAAAVFSSVLREFVYVNFLSYPLVFAYLITKYRITIKRGVYYVVLIYLCMHSLRQSVMYLSKWIHGVNFTGIGLPAPTLLVRIFYSALYIALLSLLFMVARRFIRPKNSWAWRHISLLSVTLIPVFYLSHLGILLGLDQANLHPSAVFVGQTSSLCGLALLGGFDRALSLQQNKHEVARMEGLLMSQHAYFHLKKETVEILNSKYHDLKNHLLYLNREGSNEVRKEYVRLLEKEIDAYEALRQTGNETLDVVLAGKGLLCAQQKTKILLHMDGALLHFLSPLSIATIFGNALDNAMEALAQVEESKREIVIRTVKKDSLLILRFENRYENELRFEGERLLSTKTDKDLHGFGLSNLEKAVQAYGGHVSVDTSGTQFVLNILFPLSGG